MNFKVVNFHHSGSNLNSRKIYPLIGILDMMQIASCPTTKLPLKYENQLFRRIACLCSIQQRLKKMRKMMHQYSLVLAHTHLLLLTPEAHVNMRSRSNLPFLHDMEHTYDRCLTDGLLPQTKQWPLDLSGGCLAAERVRRRVRWGDEQDASREIPERSNNVGTSA
jgi:hypothetical protein